jgi:hypothetical protein
MTNGYSLHPVVIGRPCSRAIAPLDPPRPAPSGPRDCQLQATHPAARQSAVSIALIRRSGTPAVTAPASRVLSCPRMKFALRARMRALPVAALAFALAGFVGAGCAVFPRRPPAPPRPAPGYERLRDTLAAVDASGLAGRRIALDPGHGGSFRGALGVGGRPEGAVPRPARPARSTRRRGLPDARERPRLPHPRRLHAAHRPGRARAACRRVRSRPADLDPPQCRPARRPRHQRDPDLLQAR